MKMNSGMNVLVISDNKDVISKTKDLCSELENSTVRIASTPCEGIDQIVKNGFDITIFDSNIKLTNDVNMKDLIQMNHFVNKNMIVLCDNFSETRVKRLIKSCKLKDSYITTLNTSDTTPEDLQLLIENSLHMPKRNSKKILRKLMSEIDKNKQSIFEKYKFLSFV